MRISALMLCRAASSAANEIEREWRKVSSSRRKSKSKMKNGVGWGEAKHNRNLLSLHYG